MDPVSIAIGAAVVGGTTKAFGSVMAGQERAAAQKFEAQQAERESEIHRIAGAQAETRRREHLTSSLETIMAIRAGRGVGEASPTALAAGGEIISDESRDIRGERLTHLSRADQERMKAQMLRRQSKMSLLSGYIGAVGDVASSAFSIGSVGTPRPR